MLESEAIIVSIKNGTTFVEPHISEGCGQSKCTQQGCGTVVLTQLFSQKPKTLEVSNPIDAGIGERVMVGLQEKAFLKTTLAVYFLPLGALLLGAALGMFSASTSETRDLYAGIGALIGLIGSVFLLKDIAPIFFPRAMQPIILRRL